MALKKKVRLEDTDIIIRYWKILDFYADMISGVVHFRLGGYPTDNARRSGKAPVVIMPFIVPAEDLDMDKSLPQQIYQLLKQGRIKTVNPYGEKTDFTMLEGADDC